MGKLLEATMRHRALTDEFIRNIQERTEAAMCDALESVDRSNNMIADTVRKQEVEKRRNQVFSIKQPK